MEVAENQSIVPDWVEMHFRMSDPGILSSPEQQKSYEERMQKEPSTKLLNTGAASPKPILKGRDYIKFGRTSIKRQGNGNKFYQDLYHVHHRGKKFGVILANSRDHKLMPVDDMQLQVINNKLYERGWLDDLQQITSDMQSKWHNFTRLDIAIDGGKFLHLFDKWHSKKIVKTGRAALNAYFTNKGVTNGFYIGMSKSKKRMKVYNKSQELNKSNKTYISNFWKLHGIDCSQQIERLELTIRNEESKKYKDIDWKLLDDPTHLASIMRSNMDKFCDFRLPDGQKNISRMKKIELVNWQLFKAEALPKDSTRPTTEIFSAKVTIKKLYEIHLTTQQQTWFDHAFEIAINSDLVQWFNKMQKLWSDDLNAKLGANADGEISDSWVTNFKTYELNEQVTIFEHDKVSN